MPSALTTLGVLGTFLGITIGLYDFKTANISDSITDLLEGLKMAFGTSIAGMTTSIIVNSWINRISDEFDQIIPSSEQDALNRICTSIETMSLKNNDLQIRMISLLEKQYNGFSTLLEEIKNTESRMLDVNTEIIGIHNQFDNVEKYIVLLSDNYLKMQNEHLTIQKDILNESKNLSSVVKSEIISIKTGMEENGHLMEDKFNEFSTLMRKNNVEALVEVMKKVTEEFNYQMKELLDRLIQENFKELNKSVERLNSWQEDNKQMIIELTDQYRDMTVRFKDTSDILDKVANNTHVLVKDDGKLQRLISELQKVLIDDSKFTELTESLVKAVTEVHEGTEAFDKATTELNTWIRNHIDIGDGIRLLIKKLDEINKIKDYNEQFWQDTKKNLNEGVGIIAQASQELNNSVSVINEEFYERLNTTLSNLDACIQAMHERRKS